MKHLMLMMVVAVSLVSQSALASNVGPMAKGEQGTSMICTGEFAVKGNAPVATGKTITERPATGGAADSR